MPYKYSNIEVQRIAPPGQSFPVPVPAFNGIVSIGERLRITALIKSSGTPDTVTSKNLNVNIRLFGSGANSTPTNAGGWQGYTPNGPTGLNPGILQVVGDPSSQNLAAIYEIIDATTIYVRIEFYVTADMVFFMQTSGADNRRRFMHSLNGPAGSGFNSELDNSYNSAYTRLLNTIDLIVKFNNVPTLDDNDLPLFKEIVQPQWYDRGPAGGLYKYHLKDITNTASGDIIAYAKWKTGNPTVPATASNFDVISDKLSTFTKNNISIKLFRNQAYQASVAAVRVLLFRTDNINNNQIFNTAISLLDTLIPASQTGPAQIVGAVEGPAGWAWSPTFTDVNFVLNGDLLQYGAKYRIITILYHSGGSTSSHISPLMLAVGTLEGQPKISGTITDYNKKYFGNDLIVSPHDRLRLDTEFTKSSWGDYLTNNGLMGDYENDFIQCVVNIRNTQNTLLYAGYVNTSSNQNLEVFQDADFLKTAVSFRVPNAVAGESLEAKWYYKFNITLPDGTAEVMQFIFTQKITVREYDNNIINKIDNIRLLDYDDYMLGTITPVLSLYGREKIILETHKIDPLSFNHLSFVYPSAHPAGLVSNAAVKEEENYTGLIPQNINNYIIDIDPEFTSAQPADKAFAVLNVTMLTPATKYYFEGMAKKKRANYCPILQGFPPVPVYMLKNSAGWYLYIITSGLYLNAVNEATPDGAVQQIQSIVTNPAGNTTGVNGILWGNPATSPGSNILVNIADGIDIVNFEYILQVQSDHNGNATDGIHTVEIKINHTFNRTDSPDGGWWLLPELEWTCEDLDG